MEVCVGLFEGSYTASAYDRAYWGLTAEAESEAAALEALVAGGPWQAFERFLLAHGEQPGAPTVDDVRVIERRRFTADEQAFGRDQRSASDAELDRTLAIHGWARSDLLEMLSSASERDLDWADPDRVLPDWAWWRTPRQMALHIAITESHYYLSKLGVPPPDLPIVVGAVPTTADVWECLHRSFEHVREVVPLLPRDLELRYDDGELWTTTKSIWRLAWHERGENDVIRELLAKAARR